MGAQKKLLKKFTFCKKFTKNQVYKILDFLQYMGSQYSPLSINTTFGALGSFGAAPGSPPSKKGPHTATLPYIYSQSLLKSLVFGTEKILKLEKMI